MESSAVSLDELFGDPDRARSASEVQETISLLEGIVRADFRNLYSGEVNDRGVPELLSPREWPDNEAWAVSMITPTTSGLKLQFVDKTRAIDMLAKLKGQYKNEETNANPLEAAFARLPRGDLLKLAEVLQHLVKSSTEEPA